MSIRSRRQFLAVAACATAEVCVVGCGGKTPTIVAQRRKTSVRVERSVFDRARGRRRGVWVDATGLRMPLILIQDDDGTLYAVTSECTHESCAVRPTKNYLACTCHGASYDFQGHWKDGPAREDLTRFPVTDKGDFIDIQL